MSRYSATTLDMTPNASDTTLRYSVMHARHSPVPAVTRRSVHSLGAVRAAWVLAHCALDPVLTKCTVYSHYLDHYSWIMFMNTVHRIFKKIKIK